MVKPPSNPVKTNNLSSVFIHAFVSKIPANKPMSKQPKILVRKIPNGNEEFSKYSSTVTESRNRDTAPINPPAPIAKKVQRVNCNGLDFYWMNPTVSVCDIPILDSGYFIKELFGNVSDFPISNIDGCSIVMNQTYR